MGKFFEDIGEIKWGTPVMLSPLYQTVGK